MILPPTSACIVQLENTKMWMLKQNACPVTLDIRRLVLVQQVQVTALVSQLTLLCVVNSES